MQVKQYHVTVLSNFLLAYDKYSQTYNKSRIKASTYPDVFFLLDRSGLGPGIEKNLKLLNKLNYADNQLLVLETQVDSEKLIDNELTGTGLGRYIESALIEVSTVYFISDGELIEVRIEDAIAQAYHVVKPLFPGYHELMPRSVSILPIAKGCQASCDFCFSSASISQNQKQARLDFERIQTVLNMARAAGAMRAVITGGGEPGLLPRERLIRLIKMCREKYEKIVLITNGYFIANAVEPEVRLNELALAGLSVLSISRHHFDDTVSASIMNLQVDISGVFSAYHRLQKITSSLSIRLICVLQKGGIDTEEKITAYIQWAMEHGITQICFKELYVSSSTESMFYEQKANDWSYENQVSLKLLINMAKMNNWPVISDLPWGSPVYEVKGAGGCRVSVAAYTEPTVSWELQNRLCRSWNLMADGCCYASLETLDSQVLARS